MSPLDTTDAAQPDGQILHPGSRQLFVYWEKLRAERPFIGRHEIELEALKAVLPDLVIIEKDHLRRGFRYRLAGTRVCELFRANLTSRNALADWDSFEADVIGRHLALVHGEHQPILARMRLTTDARQTVAAEFLGLPVQATKTGAMQILGGFFPFRPAAKLGHAAIVARELLSIRAIWTEHTYKPASVMPKRSFTVIDGGLLSPELR